MSMKNFEETLFEEDEFAEGSTNTPPQPQDQPEDQPVVNYEDTIEESDLTTDVLKLKGISDPSKIKFEDESGAIIERDWDSLSREEQINILSQSDPIESSLDDSEIELLNSIRSSGLSVSNYLSQLQNKTEEKTHSYKVDALSDEDLYALDLLEKVGSENISDEELNEAVDAAKQNESLFKKTVEGLRNEYIRLQQDEEAAQANRLAEEQQQSYNKFAASIVNEIRGLNSFAGRDLELSSEDSEDLAAFMLDLDDSGISAFGHALQDPKLFTKAAFWLLNEDTIVEELTKQMQDTYKRGYEAAKQDLNKPAVVFKPKPQSKPANSFADDDDWL